jgi:hypothetical protein
MQAANLAERRVNVNRVPALAGKEEWRGAEKVE